MTVCIDSHIRYLEDTQPLTFSPLSNRLKLHIITDVNAKIRLTLRETPPTRASKRFA